MAQHLIPINIIVADRSYRLRIEAEDEEMVRKTIKRLNEKIIDYKTNFAGKDMQDYVSMVLLWYATEQQKPSLKEIEHSNTEEKLNKIEELLNKALSAK
jgi:cell division protein ZapA